jgi:hypothetical protein
MVTQEQPTPAESRQRLKEVILQGCRGWWKGCWLLERRDLITILQSLDYIEALEALIGEHVRDDFLKLYGSPEHIELVEQARANVLARVKGDGD